MWSRGALVCVLSLLGLCAAQPQLRAHEPGSPVGGPVVFRPSGESPLRLEGVGTYRGSLEARRTQFGITVVNEVTLDEYVMGVLEVPASWPMEALKAQAVAARTYALWERERGYWQPRGYDICGTTSCQVYSGTIAEHRRNGDRWVKAVRDTSGEVLLWDDSPALARYHASSGGRTLNNEVVYPSSGPRPYLKGVDDPADDVSPLHRWSAEFPGDTLQKILAEAIDLAGTLVDVDADPDGRRLVVRTEGGELEMNIVRFRREVSEHAPKLFPRQFPGARPDGRPLPMTLPSSRFTVTKTGDGFRVDGVGYGHGVGMSQWGAKGRAERGASYREILAGYYGGLSPVQWQGDKTVRVAVARGVETATVFGEGSFGVTDGANTLAEATLGTWNVTAGSNNVLDVHPPEGYQLPLVLSALEAPQEFTYDPPDESTVEVKFVVPKPARVAAHLRLGDDVVASAQATFEAGAGALRLSLDGDKLPRREKYSLAIEAFDGSDRVTRVLDVEIAKAGPGPEWLAGLALLLILIVGGLLHRGARPDGRRGPDRDEGAERRRVPALHAAHPGEE